MPSDEALDEAGDADLVDHLGQLAGAGRAEPLAHPRVGAVDDRLGRGIGVLVAAAHHGEHAVLGAGLAARHRRVDEVEAALRGCRVEFARHFRGCGGVVDEDGALLHAGKRAVGAERHRAQVVVIADAAHHEILALGGVLWRRGGLAAELVGPLLGLCCGAVVDGHLMAALLDEVSCHRKTHHAETEKSDFRHVATLGVWPAACERGPAVLGGRAHHNHCAGEGNGFVWLKRPVLC